MWPRVYEVYIGLTMKVNKDTKQHRAYVWTLNNYTADEVAAIKGNTTLRYCVYGEEVGESGTPHLQGYVELHKPKTIAAMHKEPGFARAYFSARLGTRDQARGYCLKNGQFTELGNWNAGGQGRRTDWQQLIQAIHETPSLIEIAKEFPEETIKYSSGIKAMINAVEEQRGKERLFAEFDSFKPYKWQLDLLNDLQGGVPADPRKVIWYDDEAGNTGKTYISKYLAAKYEACYLTNAKSADIAHAYRGEPIVIFDFSRSVEEHLNYSIIEQIKNGMVFSPKYDSRTKRFATPHIICMANFRPEATKLSLDRWDLRTIGTNMSVTKYKATRAHPQASVQWTLIDVERPIAVQSIIKESYDRGNNVPCHTIKPSTEPRSVIVAGALYDARPLDHVGDSRLSRLLDNIATDSEYSSDLDDNILDDDIDDELLDELVRQAEILHRKVKNLTQARLDAEERRSDEETMDLADLI